MANEEHLANLRKGFRAWEEWRTENPHVEIDLSGAYLEGAVLVDADLSKANLTQANLIGAGLRKVRLSGAILELANLSEATLQGADLYRANLKRATLRKTDFQRGNLRETDLAEADLRGAHLNGTSLTLADLERANLEGAIAWQSSFREANLREADLSLAIFNEALFWATKFSGVTMDGTIFVNTDLSEVIGLEDVEHHGPSTISTDTLTLSRGKIPEAFLRGCGLSDWEIEVAKLYNPDLSNEEINDIQYKMYDLRASRALQVSPLFISYSHANSQFVDKIGWGLTTNGVRYWRDIHDMKSGRIEKQIDRAIGHNPTLLLVLSERSLASDWVEHEVHTARELERELGRDVLCPVALDDSWKSSRWPKRVMEQIMEYNILDFSAWKDDSKFEGMFRKLIDGLKLFYKG